MTLSALEQRIDVRNVGVVAPYFYVIEGLEYKNVITMNSSWIIWKIVISCYPCLETLVSHSVVVGLDENMRLTLFEVGMCVHVCVSLSAEFDKLPLQCLSELSFLCGFIFMNMCLLLSCRRYFLRLKGSHMIAIG